MKPNASERKVLLICGALGGALCSAPGEIVSAGFVWAVTLIFFFVHRRLLKQEASR